MGRSQAVLELILQAKEEGSRAVRRFADNVGGLEKNLGRVAAVNDAATGAFDAFNQVMGSGVVQAAQLVYDLGLLGAQSLRTKNAFVAISGGAEEAEQRLDAMAKATQGALSQQDMMTAANRLMQMGLASNAEELGRVSKMATTLGRAMGVDANEAIESFALTLANQSLPRLDLFGISAGAVRERIGELQASTEGLARDQAFMMAVMEEGERAMSRLGDTTGDLALSFEQAQARMEDAKATIGEALAPAVAWFMDLMARGITELTQWGTRLKQWYGGLAAGALHLLGMNDAAVKLLDSLGLLEEQVDDTTQASAEMAAEVAPSAAAYAEQAGIIEGASVAAAGGLDEMAEAGSNVAQTFGELEIDDQQIWKMALATGRSTTELAELAVKLGIASEGEIALALAADQVAAEFAATGDVDAYIEKMALLQSGQQLATDSAGDLVSQQIGVRQAADDAAAAIDAYNRRMAQTPSAIRTTVTTTYKVELPDLDAIRAKVAGIVNVNIPTYQHGTSFHPGGLAIVGERGPELVQPPRGSQVFSADATRGMLQGGGGMTVRIENNFGPGSVMDDRFIDEITRRQAEALERQGIRTWGGG